MKNKSDGNNLKRGGRAKPSPELCTLAQLERLVDLKQFLLKGTFPNTPQLAAELEVSVRTVGRAIVFLRDRMDMPIVFNRERQGYHFAGPVGQFPGEKPSNDAVAGAVLAIKALEPYQGMPWHGPAQNILQGYVAQVKGSQKELTENLGPAIYFQQPEVTEDTDPKLFELIANGLCNDAVLYMDYCKPLDIYRPRVIEPYVMTSWENCWYLLGRDRVSGKIRTFKLYRMRNARLSSQRFEMPKGFNPKEHYKKSMGIFTSDGDYKVVVELSAWLTARLEGRRYRAWETWKKNKDGTSIVKMHLSCLEEVQRWVSSWTDEVRVIKPRKLLETVYSKARKVVDMYEPLMKAESKK